MTAGGARESAAAGRSRSTVWEQTILLCCLIGTTQMTWGTLVPALPLYIDQFGATALILGTIIAAFGMGRVISNIPAGLALRWWRPRPYLRTVAILLVLVTALTGFSPDAGVLIAARVLSGVLGGAAVTIGFAILVAGAPPDIRGRVMAAATVVQMSAGAVGAFLGGLVLTWFPLEVAFVVASLPLAFCLVWDAVRPASHYWQSLRTRDLPTTHETPRVRSEASTGLWGIVVALAIGSFATFFARFGGEQGLIPLLGYERGGLTPLTLGVALAAATAVSLAALPLIGAVVDRGSRLAVLIPATLAAALGMVLFPLADGPWFFAIVIVVYGLASSIAGVVPSVIMSESVPRHQSGFVVGVTRTAGDVGAVVGPLVVFAAYDAFGWWAPVGVIAAVLLVSGALLVRAVVRIRLKGLVAQPT